MLINLCVLGRKKKGATKRVFSFIVWWWGRWWEKLTRPVTMWLLDAAGDGRRLARGLRGELLARSLSSGRFTSGLFRTGHCYCYWWWCCCWCNEKYRRLFSYFLSGLFVLLTMTDTIVCVCVVVTKAVIGGGCDWQRRQASKYRRQKV